MVVRRGMMSDIDDGADMDQQEWQNREAARQLSIILIKRGVNCRLITSEGISCGSVLRLGMANKNLSIYWRSKPEKLGCELSYVKDIVRGTVLGRESRKRLDPERCIGLIFPDYKIQLETIDSETCIALHLCLHTLLDEVASAELEKDKEATNTATSFMAKLRSTANRISLQQEKQYQMITHASVREGAFICYNVLRNGYHNRLRAAYSTWVTHIRNANMAQMAADKHRWRLHAVCNMDIDLQAWYHSIFHSEVFRIRGPFWYREAALANYKRSYDLVNNTLTPLEESALAHVLCSTETSYGDVAGQMYVVQEIVKPDIFELFQRLAAAGVTITKYPRNGRPARKIFRISFVEGSIYLTWKGKFGNQGVELNTVSALKHGIATDITRKLGKADKANLYLSLISVGRSVDLCFDVVEDREKWEDLLAALIEKELGRIKELIVDEPDDAPLFDLLALYAALRKKNTVLDKAVAPLRQLRASTNGGT